MYENLARSVPTRAPAETADVFNLGAAFREVAPVLDVVAVRVEAGAQERLVGAHEDEGVVLVGRDGHEVEHVRGVPRVVGGGDRGLEGLVERPEAVLGADEVLAVDLGERVDLRVHAFDRADVRDGERAGELDGGFGRVMLEGDAELVGIGLVGEVRILHVALAEEVDAGPHAFPAVGGQTTYFGLKEKRTGSP